MFFFSDWILYHHRFYKIKYAALRIDAENTPLQAKLNRLAELIAKLGSLAGCILFAALLIRFFVQLGTNDPPRCV